MGAARRREAPFPENAADTGQLSLSERPQYVLRGLVEEDVAFIRGRRRRDPLRMHRKDHQIVKEPDAAAVVAS